MWNGSKFATVVSKYIYPFHNDASQQTTTKPPRRTPPVITTVNTTPWYHLHQPPFLHQDQTSSTQHNKLPTPPYTSHVWTTHTPKHPRTKKKVWIQHTTTHTYLMEFSKPNHLSYHAEEIFTTLWISTMLPCIVKVTLACTFKSKVIFIFVTRCN